MNTITIDSMNEKKIKEFLDYSRSYCRSGALEHGLLEAQVKEVLKRSVALAYHEGVVEAYQILAIINMNENDGEMAYNALIMSENFIGKYRLPREAYLELYNTMVIYYQDFIGDCEMAAKMCEKGVALARDLGNQKMLMKFTANLGTMHVLFGDYDEAIVNIQIALDYYKTHNDQVRSLYCLSNLGEAYLNAGDHEKAELNLNEAMKTAVALDENLIIEEAAVSLAKIYKNKGRDFEAISLLEDKAQRVQNSEHKNVGIKILLELIASYVSREDFIMADMHMREFEAHYDCHRNGKIEMHYYQLKSKIALSFGDYKLAHTMLSQYHDLYVASDHENTEKILSNIKTSQLVGTIERLEKIGNVGRKLTRKLSDDHILMTLAGELACLLAMDTIGLGIVDDKHMVYSFSQDAMDEVISFNVPLGDESFGNWVISKGKALMINDITSEYGLYLSKEPKVLNRISGKVTKAIISVPLIVEDRVIGLISVQSYKSLAYTTQDLETLKVIGSYVAIAVMNAQQTRELQHLSYRDPLTNLCNRGGLMKRFTELGQEDLSSIHMVMMDLDYFKEVNDRFGHVIGDKSLQAFGTLLSNYASKFGGLAARLGGEEFAFILKNIEDHDCKEVLESLLVEVRNIKIPCGDEVVKITTSMGVYHHHSKELPGLDLVYKYADRALYLAKRGGRDRIHNYN